ncbi:hypothetical protein Pmar_PMAR008297 [Perkinsus marinus ATCC 50983]|uniref:N-acetyltransferase domain-containing protein n=1 Tax=Perkinsus marinus (strain ATCC 50983 / TXsc) TaxID=423536 RepID=C5LAT8_PERM5|nr:hypothetical protein Pmar_PMAR008297 [Perkinsus marinus ATCC 50983]EER06165.1 hypothetical protein Pmar_PMAR008297 [Perkinsus marinus ATCC 50983]|eukprot:XP_002774349.1 hypothetical protein Pmar_PMAR008297 [Perkinsus marinus ATCC 50983]
MTSILLPYLFYVMLPIVIGLELRTLKDFNGKRRIKKHPLEFRLAKSAEEKQTPKEYKDSKVFVAIENRFLSRKVIAGSVEFGVVQTDYHGDWVYINKVSARGEYKKVLLETEILDRLIQYIHKADPGAVAVWARLPGPIDASEKNVYLEAGFEDRGVVDSAHNLVYVLPRPTAEVLPIIADGRLEYLLNNLLNAGVANKGSSNRQKRS